MIANSKREMESTLYEATPSLSWEQYQNYCHQPAWEESSSLAQVQVQCAHLEGISVSWEGYVTKVKLKSIKNTLEKILSKLPDAIRIPLTCSYGDAYEENCTTGDELSIKNCKTLLNLEKRQNKCHLAAWNKYEFEISVKMKSGIWGSNGELILMADHSFANFSLNIYSGDKIWFVGTLTNSGLEGETMLGGSRPHLQLEEVGCHVCHTTKLKPFKRHRHRITVTSVMKDVYLGVKSVLNFLLNPLVIFK